jgi:predicted TIM-barrel fold metal-dependent hydrolase
MTAIDIHPHIIGDDMQRYPLAPVGGHQSDWSRTRPVTLPQMLAAMKAAGVQKAALVQASTCYGHDNSYVADAVAAHPDKFTGVFSVDVFAPDATERIRFWRGKRLTGLRIFSFGSTMTEQAPLDDPRSYPAWECAAGLELPVCLQMSGPAIPQVVQLVKRFPRVRVILDHLARPALDAGPPYHSAASLFSLARHPNVYLKATPRVFIEARRGKATPESFFGRLVEEFGARRIAWGSNYPASEGTLGELLALAKSSLAFLSQQDQEWIFAGTARTLYPALA